MTILTKYILREFLKVYVYSLAVAATLFFVIDLFERLDTFLKHQAGFVTIIQYFLCKLPSIILQINPIAVLLATFITLGILSRNFEIVALRAGGISLLRTAIPILATTLIISVLVLISNETIAPYANNKMRAIYNAVKGRQEKRILDQDQIWYRGEEAIYNIVFFSHRTDSLHGVTLYYFDDDFHLSKRIDAKNAQWHNNQWVFREVVTRNFKRDKTLTTSFQQQAVIPLKETPDTFKQKIRKPEEMSYRELKEYIAKTTREGYDITKYLADMYAKISSPFINFIISLLGIPFAIRLGRHGGFALGVTFSFVIGFTYWVFFNICLALGHGGALPPFISAWIANLIFGTLGVYSLLQVRY
jgi:lipopolysaccharide export system permease protein